MKKPSKAATYAKANRALKPRPLWLQYDDWFTNGKRNPNGVTFDVSDLGQLEIDGNTFTARDALRLARWIEENFR